MNTRGNADWGGKKLHETFDTRSHGNVDFANRLFPVKRTESLSIVLLSFLFFLFDVNSFGVNSLSLSVDVPCNNTCFIIIFVRRFELVEYSGARTSVKLFHDTICRHVAGKMNEKEAGVADRQTD